MTAGIEWEDATSYSRSERGEAPPNAWEATINGARIWVSCAHLHYPGDWVVTCLSLDIDCIRLGGAAEIDSHEARRLALRLVKTEAEMRARSMLRVAKSIDDALGTEPKES